LSSGMAMSRNEMLWVLVLRSGHNAVVYLLIRCAFVSCY